MLPPGEYKRGVGWTCHGNSACCQITLVLVSVYNRHCICWHKSDVRKTTFISAERGNCCYYSHFYGQCYKQ